MPEFTIADLVRIMRECAGQDESVALSDIEDTPLAELGYDSLAVLETAARISVEFGVRLDDDFVSEATTPGRFVDLVNAELTAKAG